MWLLLVLGPVILGVLGMYVSPPVVMVAGLIWSALTGR